MNLQEHDKNRFTKEKSDLEKYLLRIIQRYFDIENNYTQKSIEAIIVESLTRFKRDILKEKGYLFSLNQMTGNITLTIQDFGGEYKFDKNNAFNKNFGIDTDTICEGNDPRLSDKREPNKHVHVIDDVIGLRELLDSINVNPGSHIHSNKNVLDMIKYSGSLAEFDLQIIETLSDKINKYYANLQFQKTDLSKYTDKQIETLDTYITVVKQDLENAKLFIQDAVNWFDDISKYITQSVNKFHQEQLAKLSEYITKAQVEAIMEYLKKAYFVVSDGEFPITDGEISMTPIEEPFEDIATTDDSSSLLNIYNTGFTVGQNDSSGNYRWIWDDSVKSFKYLGNMYTDYPRFLNNNAYESYTHRVTLKSTNSDDDVISTVIAYDRDTGNDLSVICSCGDAGGASGINVPSISLRYNFFKSNAKNIANNIVIDPSSIVTKNSAGGNGWAAIPNGVTILIKKDKRRIRVWASLNGIGAWIPDSNNDIQPTEQPIFDIDMDLYPELAVFPNKTCYGYGTHSQAYSFYQDVYFLGKYELSYPYGHTDIQENKTIQKTIPSSVMNSVHNGRIKMFFKYTKDGKEYTHPLPFCFKDEENRDIVVQGNYSNNGNINIQINLSNSIPLYGSKEKNLYGNTIIAISDIVKDSISTVRNAFSSYVKIAKIDSIEKEQFVRQLITNKEKQYLIQGICTTNDNVNCNYFDYENNPLIYTNFTHVPSANDLGILESLICYDYNEKMKIINDSTKILPVILEYKIPRITEYFENPRIYYQVLGNKEGM